MLEMNDPKHTVPVLHMELRPRVTREEFARAWTHLQEHLLNEMAVGEPEGRAVTDAIDTWLADTLVILALVEPPGRRAGTSDVWDPLTASWRPMPSAPTLMMRERLPGDLLALSASGYQKMRNDLIRLVEENTKLCLRQEALHHAQAVAESLWHTLNQIATLQSSDYEHSDAGELASYRARVRHLADRRLMLIAELPADETISDGAWMGKIGPSLRDDLAELGRLREQVAAYQEWSKALADYIVEHHKPLMVDDKAVAILDGYHVGLTPVAGPSAGGENTLAAAVRLLKLAAERGAFMAFARPFEQNGVRAVEIGDGAVPVAVWQIGDTCTVDGEAQDVFRVDRLGPLGAALVNSRGAVHGWEGYRKMHKVVEVVETRFTEVHYDIGEANEPRTVLRFEGLPDVSLPDADMAALVRQHAAKSTGPAGDQRTRPDADLSERADVMATNLLHVTEGEGYLSPAAESAIKSAAALLVELGEALKPSAFFWVVDEFCDNEGETFGIAIPAAAQVDEALARWAKTYDEVVAREERRDPHPDPFGVELGGSGDKLTFRPRRTDSNLEALGEDDENGYSARIRMLKPEGVAVLLKAIAAIPVGGSLALYKGQLSTCYADEDGREPADVADLWELCDDDMFTDDGLDLRGDHHHADDMAVGEDDDADDLETEDDLDES